MVQTYPTAGTTVTAGSTATFVVWVWTTKATASNVSIRASVIAASYLGVPGFAICPSATGVTCKLSSLAVGQVFELLASVPVSTAAPLAAHVAFTAQASASGAFSDSASAMEVVAASSNATLPSSTTVVPPLVGLPPIPGTSVSPINPSQLFPIVTPSSGTANTGTRTRSGVPVAVVSSTVPIDTRLLGAQLVGLAVLAGAVTIAIMRLSLRRREAAAATPATAAATPAAPATPTSAPEPDSSQD